MRRAIAAVLLWAAQGPEDDLRVCWAPPVHLDPHRATSAVEARYVGALFEGLVTHEADGVTPAPGMAREWRAEADGLAWTFTLREASWSNGDPVRADDFVFSWRRAVRSETGCEFAALFRAFRNVGAWLDQAEADALLARYEDFSKEAQAEAAGRLEQVARRRHAEPLRRRGALGAARAAEARPDVAEGDLGFRAVDARTLRVTLERPAPWLLDLLAAMPFVPLHEPTLSAHGREWVKPANIVTNGPFLFEEATPFGMALRRSPRYWEPPPAGSPGRIAVEFSSEELALEKFREGRLDWVARERVAREKAQGTPGLVSFDGWGTVFLRFNAARPPFDRREVRAAFARAVDRKKAAAAARATPAERLVPAGVPGYPAAEGLPLDGAAAMEGLLRATGFDLSKFPRVQFLAAEGALPAAVAEALREGLEKTLGVGIEVRTVKGPALYRALSSGEFHLALGGWAGDTLDPLAFLEGWTKGHAQNASGWADAEYDELLARAGKAAGPKERLELLSRAEARLLSEAPVVPLYAVPDVYLAGPRIDGLRPNPMARFPLKRLRIR
jgi:oligopeptide transport system substrate-binding protein